MEEQISLVTRKGQITLPAELRRLLGIREGDKVAVTLGDPAKGEIVVRPVRSVAEATFGAVKPRQRPENWQELRRQFEEEAAEDEPSRQP
jgi:antitoxin PrlF